MVTARRFGRSRTSYRTSWMPAGSRPLVGSSRTSRSGLSSKADAIPAAVSSRSNTAVPACRARATDSPHRAPRRFRAAAIRATVSALRGSRARSGANTERGIPPSIQRAAGRRRGPWEVDGRTKRPSPRRPLQSEKDTNRSRFSGPIRSEKSVNAPRRHGERQSGERRGLAVRLPDVIQHDRVGDIRHSPSDTEERGKFHSSAAGAVS